MEYGSFYYEISISPNPFFYFHFTPHTHTCFRSKAAWVGKRSCWRRSVTQCFHPSITTEKRPRRELFCSKKSHSFSLNKSSQDFTRTLFFSVQRRFSTSHKLECCFVFLLRNSATSTETDILLCCSISKVGDTSRIFLHIYKPSDNNKICL